MIDLVFNLVEKKEEIYLLYEGDYGIYIETAMASYIVYKKKYGNIHS